MVPVRRTQTWLPDIFNDFFDNTWMEKTNATAPAINIRETETNYEIVRILPSKSKTTTSWWSVWKRNTNRKKIKKKRDAI